MDCFGQHQCDFLTITASYYYYYYYYYYYHQVERYKALSHNLAVYPNAAAHTFERLPRLFLLLKGLPQVNRRRRKKGM